MGRKSHLHEFRWIEIFLQGFAFRAKPSNQALRKHHCHRRSQKIRRYADIYQTSYRRRTIIGVKGAENEMACHGRFDGNLRCFMISNFTHHDNIRVLPQKWSQSGGKRHSHFVLDMDLIDSFEVEFHRIFYGKYFAIFFIQFIQNRIQCRCFATARRAGDKQQSIRPIYAPFKCF